MSVRHSGHHSNGLDLPIFDRAEVRSHYYQLPWPAQRIRLRHGLTAAAALIVATEAGFALDGGGE